MRHRAAGKPRGLASEAEGRTEEFKQLEENPLKTTLVRLRTFSAAVVMLLLFTGIAHATLSTTYWTPMTMDIQGYRVLHIGVDNYFTTFRKQTNGAGSFPTDAGFTIGVLPFQKLQAEVSIDLLHPSDYPVTFSAKMGSPENALFKGSPALEIGLFNQGFTAHSVPYNFTSADTFFGVVGKTIPHIGRLSAGPYFGNSKTLVDGDGNKDNKGFMAAFDRGFLPVGEKGSEFNRLVIAADYCSGKNMLGGGGVGLYYFFTKDISLLTGPVWFNDQVVNGKWKWTIQLDINTGLFHKH
jgi:hypothetical protein